MLDTVREPGHAPGPGREPAPEGLGRYVLLRQVGRGAMGIVLAAYDPSLDRKVAIKLLREGIDAGSDAASRMQREAQAMARLSHPNVAQVYEVGESDGRIYLVMEYVDGSTLRAWLNAQPRSTAEVLRCFVEAGRGLAAAHAAGLIHRDFKPDNAMISADGRVRVLDFGLSRSVLAPVDGPAPHSSGSDIALAITAAGTLIGTPAYMSPEQHLHLEVDARSDQFSFCVALHEALYGQRPFPGHDLAAVRASVVGGAIVEPPGDSPIPGWLRQVLERGLRREPEQRWPTMDALLAALDRDPQRARRRWLAAGLAVVAVASAGYGAAAYQVAQGQLCTGAADELRDIWDAPRRDALAQVVTATGVDHAASMLTAVTTRLDIYADSWIDAHTDACEAHRRGHASAQLFDRKMACLRQRRTELAATVDVLMRTTADRVAELVEAAKLPPVATCEDEARLLADAPLPADPQVAAAVEQARARLARLQALERAGRHLEALAELDPEIAAMQRLGDVTLLAGAQLLAGKLRMHRRQDVAAARAALDTAVQLGLEARLDAIAAEALTIEIYLTGIIELRPNEALALAPLAGALVRRVGNPVELAALLHNNIGAVQGQLGEAPISIESFQRGLDLLGADSDDPLRWVLLHNLVEALNAVGEYERARALAEPAQQHLEQLRGRCHPVNVSLRMLIAAGDSADGRFASANVKLEDAFECYRVGYPVIAVFPLTYLAETALLAGDEAAARRHIARADEIVATVPDARLQLAELVIPRAELELRAGHHATARGILEAEHTRLTQDYGASNPLLAPIDTRLAILDLAQADHASALVRLERAATLLPAHAREEQGLRAFTHAQVLAALGREPSRIAALAAQAVAEYRRAGSAHAPRVAAIEAWLAASAVQPGSSTNG